MKVVDKAAEVIATAERFRPQFTLLDIGMPGISGYKLARQIRASSWHLLGTDNSENTSARSS